uniref:FLYWCH-type domain-containing protein n=1 Tax=Trichuris muris TaxID=70415 RepID=A0A5S6Q7I5_TRIMR
MRFPESGHNQKVELRFAERLGGLDDGERPRRIDDPCLKATAQGDPSPVKANPATVDSRLPESLRPSRRTEREKAIYRDDQIWTIDGESEKGKIDFWAQRTVGCRYFFDCLADQYPVLQAYKLGRRRGPVGWCLRSCQGNLR